MPAGITHILVATHSCRTGRHRSNSPRLPSSGTAHCGTTHSSGSFSSSADPVVRVLFERSNGTPDIIVETMGGYDSFTSDSGNDDAIRAPLLAPPILCTRVSSLTATALKI